MFLNPFWLLKNLQPVFFFFFFYFFSLLHSLFALISLCNLDCCWSISALAHPVRYFKTQKLFLYLHATYVVIVLFHLPHLGFLVLLLLLFFFFFSHGLIFEILMWDKNLRITTESPYLLLGNPSTLWWE